MNSTLYLIKNTPILIDRNFKVPSFDHIRRSGESYSIVEDFMYVKHNLDLTIKIESNQAGLEYKDENNINYIIIKNNTTEPKEVGYFVTRKRWISEKTIEFTLHCDTINSFIDEIELSDRTKILRQHKDRFTRNVGEPSRIGDIEIIPQASFDVSEECTLSYDESDALEHTYLYNLSKTFLWTISMVFGVSDDATTCKYYFIDEEYKVIREIPCTFAPAAFRIAYGSNGLPRELVVDGSSVSIPANAKYIAMRHVPHTINSAYFFIYVYGWEDLTDEEIEEINAEMHTYSYELVNKKGKFYEETAGDDKLRPIIDFYSEGLQPVLYGSKNVTITERTGWINQSWYLVYKNQNNPDQSLTNPVDVFLFGERTARVSPVANFTGTYSGEELYRLLLNINGVTSFEEYQQVQEKAIYIPAYFNSNGNITGSGIDPQGGTKTIDQTLGNYGLIVIRLFAPDYVQVVVLDENENSLFNEAMTKSSLSITFTGMKVATYGAITYSEWTTVNYPQINLFGSSDSYSVLNSIKSVNRTDPTIIKIIKLPYCPASLILNENGELVYDTTQWSYNATYGALKLIDFNSSMVRVLDTGINPLYKLDEIPMEEIDLEAPKNIEYECKLYHSDYYQPKIFYDSFAFIFQLELVKNYNTLQDFRIQFNTTNTLNSRFMFTFLDYECESREVRDFNNVLYVARNNECAIFNQQYVNYIRNGYNYELKANELKYRESWFSFGARTLSSGLGAAQSFVQTLESGDVSQGVNKLVSYASSTAISAYSIANSIASRELEMLSKQNQLAHQSTGVVDANDVDLLEAYSKNRLQMKIYQVSPKMRKALFDVFYYTGYICEEMGIPNTTSRYRFNFVSADIVFKKVPNLPDDIVSELKSRYLGGITFLHSNKGVIDYEQKYENWEVSILDE